MKDEHRRHLIRNAKQDCESAKDVPVTPQTEAPSYRLAFADEDFLT